MIKLESGGFIANRFEVSKDGKTLRGQSQVRTYIGTHEVEMGYLGVAKKEAI